ncbi:MAG TPA: hypothetical protein VFA81_07205 [Burkholderiales bacterium]|nr:hypothetical protein [Burkholderiales bacterium]
MAADVVAPDASVFLSPVDVLPIAVSFEPLPIFAVSLVAVSLLVSFEAAGYLCEARLEAVVEIASVACSLSLQETYAKVQSMREPMALYRAANMAA